MSRKKNVFKRTSLVLILFAVVFMFYNAKADEQGEGDYCLNLNVGYENGFSSSNVKSIKVNEIDWVSGDTYNADIVNGKLWTITFVATKNGEDFPFVSTPGGLVIDNENDPNYPGYGTYTAIPNPENENEYIITVTLNSNWSDKGNPEANPRTCGNYGVNITSGPPIEAPSQEVTSNVSITIIGDELEYHYDENDLDKADVTYFKFDINGGTEENRLVPFTFGNANYTYNDNEPPKNVSQVTTKAPIPYKYQYNGNGKVEFCVNGGGTDEYTSIKINGTEYSQYAPHTKEAYWESMSGWAQMFCIPDVLYSTSYNVVVEGRQTADENKIPGFGWSYLSKERSEDVTEEGNFAHGRLVFVSASLEIDGEEKSFGSANTFNNYRYNGKGQIFQWREGNKEYPEADRREAWGEAQMPYGTKIRVRIVPDRGYQLTGLTVSENGFQPTETPGEYELTLTRTNLSYDEDRNQFDLNPTFEKVDAATISSSDAVSNVTITIAGNDTTFDTGTPKLEVANVASMSPEREQEFDTATEDGYTINNYLEISLYNTLYKGGKKDGNNFQSWDTEVHDLQGNATIGLELEDDLGGDDIQVIHEVRDDENKIVGYDVIDAQYDRNNNIVTFETDGFSTYAIAVKASSNNEEPSNPDQIEKVRVDFEARCPKCNMEPVEIAKGSKVSKPKDPTQTDFLFLGWFTDENCEHEYDFNTPVNDNLILYAKWTDKVQTYTVKDSSGNSLTFNEIKNRRYSLTMIDITKLSDAELEAMGATREQYNQVKDILEGSTGTYGDLIGFFQIEVKDKDDGAVITEGPFKIKIKITDEMRKYNVFKFVYVNDNFEAEGVYELKAENGYLVGEIPHLSGYTLNATYDSSLPDIPKTGDNIYTWIMILLVSIIAMSFGLYKSLKLKKVRIK